MIAEVNTTISFSATVISPPVSPLFTFGFFCNQSLTVCFTALLATYEMLKAIQDFKSRLFHEISGDNAATNGDYEIFNDSATLPNVQNW